MSVSLRTVACSCHGPLVASSHFHQRQGPWRSGWHQRAGCPKPVLLYFGSQAQTPGCPLAYTCKTMLFLGAMTLATVVGQNVGFDQHFASSVLKAGWALTCCLWRVGSGWGWGNGGGRGDGWNGQWKVCW